MSLSKQTKLGKIIFFSIVFVLFIPLILSFFYLPQIQTLEGTHIRDNSPIFSRFLGAIKRNNGVLIIGTSETVNSLNNNNYRAMLDKDKTVKPYFSVLAGAGRCSYIWFPTILANEKSFSGLNILYFINPTYWRPGLNTFNIEYYDRYNSINLVSSVIPKVVESNLLPFISPYLEKYLEKEHSSLGEKFYKLFVDWRSYYSYNLRVLLFGKLPEKKYSYDNPSIQDLAEWKNGLNLEYNVSEQYYLSSNFSMGISDIDKTSLFQYQALSAFLDLSKKVGINLVVFIGPYNGILAQRNSPEVIGNYEEVIKNIKDILAKSSIPYIDGSDLSYVKGVFLDAQHHSAYGAWKIEQKIANYYRNH